MAKFKENANMFSIVDETKAPIIHGHTRIDFKDVKTGKRERIESDNTFMATTLAKYMRNFGMSTNTPYANKTWLAQNMVRNLCGGVFLFKDAIPDNAEYMQAGNKMTANGCYNVVNNGNPPEFGSWNSIESNIEGNSSAVLVWDWSTSQGNGQISSVCLTSETGGYIGYGNPSGLSMGTKCDIFANQNSNNLGNGKIIYNNKLHTLSYVNPTLTITKARKPISIASIFDNKTHSIKTFDLSTYFTSAPTSLFAFNIEHSKIMIMPNQNVADNATLEFAIYDPSDDTLVVKTIVNTTGTTVNSNQIRYFEDEGVVIIFQGNANRMYVLNETTSAVISTLNSDLVDIGMWEAPFVENLIQTAKFGFMIDLINETIYPTNSYVDANYGDYVHNDTLDCIMHTIGNISQSPHNLSPNSKYLYKNPLYLATINNLQESVTKQNTQTMKVTYTLTEV